MANSEKVEALARRIQETRKTDPALADDLLMRSIRAMDGPTYWQTQASIWQHKAEDSMVRIFRLTAARDRAWYFAVTCCPFAIWKLIDLCRLAAALLNR